MKKLFTFYFILLFGYQFISHAQSLNVLNPENPWYMQQGTIEEAELIVTPSNAFCKYELFLTFSARGTSFYSGELLEVELFFNLPAKVFVTDLWLWLGDDISRAYILDTWTASGVYEGIVQRRRDPAILFKRENNIYELRVYPMPKGETRKVKIEYYAPIQMQNELALFPLPTGLMGLSKNQVEKMVLKIYGSTDFYQPKLFEYNDFSFTEETDSLGTGYHYGELPAQLLQASLNLKYNSPMNDGLYFAHYKVNDEGYYNLIINPKSVFNLSSNKNVVFVIDHAEENSIHTREAVKNSLQAFIHSNFSETDSFNLVLSKLNVELVSNEWISASYENVDLVFDAFSFNAISLYSNLSACIKSAIEFLNTQNGNGEIVVFSSSDMIGGTQAMHQLKSDLLELMDPDVKISVMDYATTNLESYYYNGIWYNGNEYFYLLITNETGGNYFNIREGYQNFNLFINRLSTSLAQNISSLDLYTTLANGFCYSRITDPAVENVVGWNDNITQAGKYYGEFPFKISLSGLSEGNVLKKEIEISDSENLRFDSSIVKVWTGKYLLSLESSGDYNVIINVIETSIRNRILTKYTSFLALEPGDTLQVCTDCDGFDWGPTILVDEPAVIKDFTLSAYPNPFNSQVKISVKIPAVATGDKLDFKIYNILGELVRTLHLNEFNGSGTYEMFWDGKDEFGNMLPSGVYLFVASTQSNHYTLKLMYIK